MRNRKVQIQKIIAEGGAFGNIGILSKTVNGGYVISATCYHCEDRICEKQSVYCEERIYDIECTGNIYLGSHDRSYATLKDAAKAWLPIHMYFASLGVVRFKIKEMRRVDR